MPEVLFFSDVLQVEEVGSLLMAVRNLGEQCYLSHYGPLEEMDVLDMIDMIKVEYSSVQVIH